MFFEITGRVGGRVNQRVLFPQGAVDNFILPGSGIQIALQLVVVLEGGLTVLAHMLKGCLHAAEVLRIRGYLAGHAVDGPVHSRHTPGHGVGGGVKPRGRVGRRAFVPLKFFIIVVQGGLKRTDLLVHSADVAVDPVRGRVHALSTGDHAVDRRRGHDIGFLPGLPRVGQYVLNEHGHFLVQNDRVIGGLDIELGEIARLQRGRVTYFFESGQRIIAGTGNASPFAPGIVRRETGFKGCSRREFFRLAADNRPGLIRGVKIRNKNSGY